MPPAYNGVMRTTKPTVSAAKTARPAKRTPREGLRAVRIWIPDLDESSFRSEAHRQSVAVAASGGERENQSFVDAISGRVFDSE
jgi:hypothetical protein